jgi:hypothetical protein
MKCAKAKMVSDDSFEYFFNFYETLTLENEGEGQGQISF